MNFLISKGIIEIGSYINAYASEERIKYFSFNLYSAWLQVIHLKFSMSKLKLLLQKYFCLRKKSIDALSNLREKKIIKIFSFSLPFCWAQLHFRGTNSLRRISRGTKCPKKQGNPCEDRGFEPDVNRTRNLLIWSQTRYHCATDPQVVAVPSSAF